jgi:hypothetical protein
MDVSSRVDALFDSELNKAATARGMLRAGDMLNAKIIETKRDNLVLVDFGHFRAIAAVNFPVTPGETLLTKVIETGNQLRLALAYPDSKSDPACNHLGATLKIHSVDIIPTLRTDITKLIGLLLDAGKLPPHLADVLTRLQANLTSLSIGGNIATLMSQLKSHVENSGYFFEAKIQQVISQLSETAETLSAKTIGGSAGIKAIFSKDLMPNLLILKNFIENDAAVSKLVSNRNPADIKTAVDHLLADIMYQHDLAIKKQSNPDPFQVFTFSFPLKEDHRTAKVKIYYPKKKKDPAKKEFKISILLNMASIGEIRADLRLQKQDLMITFFVKNDSTKKNLETHHDELKGLLYHLFDYLVIKTVVSNKKIKEFHRQDLYFSADQHIDVRI